MTPERIGEAAVQLARHMTHCDTCRAAGRFGQFCARGQAIAKVAATSTKIVPAPGIVPKDAVYIGQQHSVSPQTSIDVNSADEDSSSG